VLIIGFLMLPLRALVFSTTSNAALVIAVQVLDGIAGAGFGILVPLVVSDVAARSGHFTLSLGAVGFAIGIGSTVSTSAAGWVADHFGMRHAFYFLASVGLAAVLLAVFAMPETRPEASGCARDASTAPRPPRRPPRGASPSPRCARRDDAA
jgi:MFS family permease